MTEKVTGWTNSDVSSWPARQVAQGGYGEMVRADIS